eukprot:9001849-Karenia_brevis.AAC.1
MMMMVMTVMVIMLRMVQGVQGASDGARSDIHGIERTPKAPERQGCTKRADRQTMKRTKEEKREREAPKKGARRASQGPPF